MGLKVENEEKNMFILNVRLNSMFKFLSLNIFFTILRLAGTLLKRNIFVKRRHLGPCNDLFTLYHTLYIYRVGTKDYE